MKTIAAIMEKILSYLAEHQERKFRRAVDRFKTKRKQAHEEIDRDRAELEERMRKKNVDPNP